MRITCAIMLSLLLLLACPWDASPSDAATGPAPASSEKSSSETPGNYYALLVGCTNYYNNQSHSLVGPGKDVEMMARLLEDKDKFNFPKDHVVVLSEAAAEKLGENFRPTYKNITTELGALAKKAQSGDQVLVLLEGHGSQEPEQDPPDPKYPKPDGRDQIFLPADIETWDGDTQHKVVNSLPDFELRRLTKAITKTGASLWLIVDSCCSGATLRGNVTARKVDPTDLGIPKAAFAKSAERAKEREAKAADAPPRGGQPQVKTRDFRDADSLYEVDPQSPNFVALYAARPDECTLELPLPTDDANAEWHGLLTYTLCEILERSSGDLTYSELHRLICNRYTQMRLTNPPKPLIEGKARVREVLGRLVPGRSRFRLTNDDGNWSVDAGTLCGLTQGSILAVYPPRDRSRAEADKLIGHVKIQQADKFSSTVTPIEYGGHAAPALTDLIKESRCEPVYLDYGSLRLKVAVDRNTVKNAGSVGSTDLSRLDQVERALQELEKQPGALFVLAKPTERPDWVVQFRDGRLLLLSIDAANQLGALPPSIPHFPLSDDDPAKALEKDMSLICRAQNLVHLTEPTTSSGQPVRGPDGLATDETAVDVEVRMLKLNDRNDKAGTPLEANGRGLILSPGDLIGWHVTNHSRFKVDVTLLFVDSEYGIQSAFPRTGAGVENMIPSGGNILAAKAKATPTTFGLDQMVVIAVPNAGQPIDFSVLEQPNIPVSRGADDPTFGSPLGRLCQNAMYGKGATRGMELQIDAPHPKLDLMSWRVSDKPAAH